MHLVINASEIGRQRGGNESFSAGLIEGCEQLNPPEQISLLTCQWQGNHSNILFSDRFKSLNVGTYRQLPFFLWQQSRALQELNADWYVSYFFLPFFIPFSKTKGAVVVHDLSFHAHPNYFPPFIGWYMRWLTGLAIRQATLVCTISEFSRQELHRFYPHFKGEVLNISSGVSAQYHPIRSIEDQKADETILAHYGITPPYIFALGNIHPRKNLARLLDAYLLLQKNHPDLPKMVWSGHPRWESETLINKAKLAGIVFTGFIDQADLPTFFRQALMLVYPSLYEGFGLPPVEAMACGTPSIVSNTTSLPEAVGDAALKINPTSVEQIADAISRLIDDATLRESLIKAGFKQVQKLTWSNTVETLLKKMRAIDAQSK